MILDTSVSPVLKAFVVGLDDDESRQRLAPLTPRIAGTAGDGHDEARAWMATDWLVRVHAPAWLRLIGRHDLADALAWGEPVCSIEAARAAQPLLDEARRVANRAWDAAREAAWEAACDAARAAGLDAAREATREAAACDAALDVAWGAEDAAWYAGRAAAQESAWYVAWAAAWDAAAAATAAARDAALEAAVERLRPTLAELQESALDLFDRMIDPQEVVL